MEPNPNGIDFEMDPDDEPEQVARDIWAYGDNDAVWDAIFERGVDVAAELLNKIKGTPDFTVGDLTHEQVIASIERRYPILGPNPNFGR